MIGIERLLIFSLLGLGSVFAQIQVAATTGFIADMLRNVGGSRVKVIQVIPNGTDPHSFEPKPSVVKNIAASRLFFANGLMLEPFLGKLEAQLPASARVVELASGMPDLIKSEQAQDDHGGFDPHLWLDPGYGIRYVEKIRDVLAQLDPAGKATFAANASRYIAQINKADARALACLKPIPAQKRKLVSQHQALAYFLRHYEITSVGSIADFAGQERGPQSFARLAKTMREQGIKVIFAEPQFSGAEAKALAEASGARVGRVYSDAFDDKVNTYLGLLEANGKAVCESFR